jgi:tRNA dimethylallyltransferase
MSHAQEKRRGAKRAVLIAGPTASGKSTLALDLAEELGGVVINADSMQVYRDLRILTARPSAEETARVPHRLYGHIDAAETYSVGRWLRDLDPVLAEAERAGRLPILVGGTGLYFQALTRGLAAVPPVPALLRDGLRARLAMKGAAALHAELRRCDPESATRIRVQDGVRIARALEVFEATGRTLSDWHRAGMPPLLEPTATVNVFLDIERAELRRRIDARFDLMIAAGAIEEARALEARGLEELHPIMKAHGVPWLRQVLAGKLTLAAAAAEAKNDTRRYAKRQFTWFRHQLPGFSWISPERARERILSALDPVGA